MQRPAIRNVTCRAAASAVHEMFKRQGYSVADTKEGPDGGIDLKLRKGSALATVQCKHWRTRKVDVRIVREQLGVMTANDADHCFVVTAGDYTVEARKFARGQPVTLIDGALLKRQLATLGGDRLEETLPAEETVLACSKCRGEMVRRTARRGKNAGEQFWGCSRFPACRGIRS